VTPSPVQPSDKGEFARAIDLRQILAKPVAIEATEKERVALARRFALVRIDRLEAEVALEVDGEAVNAKGRLRAAIVQSCAISGEDLPVAIDEPLTLRFVPEKPVVEDEIELEGSALDEIPFDGHAFDLGEAVAQSLALAIDPYAVGPNAERVRKQAGLLDFTDAETAFRTFFGLVARDVQIRLLLGDRLESTDAAIGGDAARATQQFLALYGAKTGPQGL